jgi:RNA polymerase sigma factor for flagellar operon FliA
MKTKTAERDAVVMAHIGLVYKIAHRIAVKIPKHVEIDNLISAGTIGLIQAINKYDPNKGVKFNTFATFRIKGEILEELRSRDFVGRSARKKIKAVEKAYIKLENSLNREVEKEEVANELGISLLQLDQIEHNSNIAFISICEIENVEDEMIKDDETIVHMVRKEKEAAIKKVCKKLTANELFVIKKYYFDGLLLKEAGKLIGLKESRTAQIRKNAVEKIKKFCALKGVE